MGKYGRALIFVSVVIGPQLLPSSVRAQASDARLTTSELPPGTTAQSKTRVKLLLTPVIGPALATPIVPPNSDAFEHHCHNYGFHFAWRECYAKLDLELSRSEATQSLSSNTSYKAKVIGGAVSYTLPPKAWPYQHLGLSSVDFDLAAAWSYTDQNVPPQDQISRVQDYGGQLTPSFVFSWLGSSQTAISPYFFYGYEHSSTTASLTTGTTGTTGNGPVYGWGLCLYPNGKFWGITWGMQDNDKHGAARIANSTVGVVLKFADLGKPKEAGGE